MPGVDHHQRTAVVALDARQRRFLRRRHRDRHLVARPRRPAAGRLKRAAGSAACPRRGAREAARRPSRSCSVSVRPSSSNAPSRRSRAAPDRARSARRRRRASPAAPPLPGRRRACRRGARRRFDRDPLRPGEDEAGRAAHRFVERSRRRRSRPRRARRRAQAGAPTATRREGENDDTRRHAAPARAGPAKSHVRQTPLIP